MKDNDPADGMSNLNQLLDTVNPGSIWFDRHYVTPVYRLIQREREGADFVAYLCRALTQDRMERGERDLDEVLRSDEDVEWRDYGVNCLTVLFLNVFGAEMKRKTESNDLTSTGRRMRDVWKDEGKEEEGKRRWERRWREVGDVLLEEDVMEVAVLHLCLPFDGISWEALTIYLSEQPDKHLHYHTPNIF